MNRNENRRIRNNKANANMPGPRNRMTRPGLLHGDKSQPRDLYSNPRFIDVFSRLKGLVVLVQVKSGIVHEGILHTISAKGEIVLIEASTLDQPKQSCIHPKLILKHSSIVKITAKDIDFDYPVKSDSFATDSEISQRVNGQIPERKLEAWDEPEDNSTDPCLLDSELEADGLNKGNGWDAKDMFAHNKRHFGYQTTYKGDLKEYTTPLDEEDTKEYRERRARADRLAKQIEQSPEHTNRGQIENNDEITEEEKFSSVTRLGMNPRTGPSPQTSSNNTDKYVPPQKRQTTAVGYPRSVPGRKQSPSRTPNSGPGRPELMAGDRQLPQAQAQTFIPSHHQPSKQQQQQVPPAGHIGAMSTDYNRVQPHHSPQPQQHQPKSQHHHPSIPQQLPYQQRPPVVDGVGGSKDLSSSLNPMGPKFYPATDNEQQKRGVNTLSEQQSHPPSEVALQRSEHHTLDTNRSTASSQIPPLDPTTEGQTVTDKIPSRTNMMRELKNFSENFGLPSEKQEIPENKVPAHSSTPSSMTGEMHTENMSPPIVGVTAIPVDPSAQPEMKAAGTSPMSQLVLKTATTVEKDRTEVERVHSSAQQKLNPNAKPFIPSSLQRVIPQKTPTPPLSRSPQMASPMIAAHYLPPSMAAMYGQGGPYIVTTNAPHGGLQQYAQMPKQVHQPRGQSRVEYSFPPALAAGQPLVTPIQQGQQYITVTTGGQGMQQAGSLKVMPAMLNHVMKPTMSYRPIPNNNPAMSAMHPQSQQLVSGPDGVMMPQMMAFQSQAVAQSQPLQQQHPQGSVPSNQYMHAAHGQANANQMQQSHHTTPPLQQSQQPQGSNHPVIAPQGQFPQHGGRPSPGPMPPQMAHAQAQAQVVHSVTQQQGGMPQLVAVSQGGQPAIVYTHNIPQSQHGHGLSAQHASQQYGNLPQHLSQNMQVPPTHVVPSNMANITNVTRVHPDPHPHPHPAAATLYINQPITNQAGMVQSHQLQGSYMQHGAAYQPGN